MTISRSEFDKLVRKRKKCKPGDDPCFKQTERSSGGSIEPPKAFAPLPLQRQKRQLRQDAFFMQGDDDRARVSRNEEGRGGAVAGKRRRKDGYGRDSRDEARGRGDGEPRAGIGRGRRHGYTGRSGCEQ